MFLQHRYKTVNDIIQPLDKAVKNVILNNRWGLFSEFFFFHGFRSPGGYMIRGNRRVPTLCVGARRFCVQSGL